MLRKGLLVLTITVLLGAAAPPAAASATSGHLWNSAWTNGTGAHWYPYNNQPVAAWLPVGQSVRDFCWDDTNAQTLNGEQRWDVVYVPGANRAGWTNQWYLSRGDQTLWCSDWFGMAGAYGVVSAWLQNGTTGIHTCPDSTCPVLTMMQQNDKAIEFCWTVGAPLWGVTSWTLVRYPSGGGGGYVGWVHDNYLSWEKASPLGRC